MSERRETIQRTVQEAARGRSERTPWFVLGGVTLVIAAVAGVLIAIGVLVWVLA
ncbi:MAG TPA: hypothetical protein VFB26_10495 [Gaiellaceae bacterium]|nr:hypothetical protein [Gaiellaceae bacterium]